MQSDTEPAFGEEITDLKEQQRGSSSTTPRHSRWRWGMGLFLLLALLAGVQLVWVARPLFLPPHIGRSTPRASSITPPTPVAGPLHFPVVRSLATCPVSVGRRISPNFGLAARTGPLYIVAVDTHGTVDYVPPALWGADHLGWGGMSKTLWVFPGVFSGPVLVRGQQLDQAGLLRFNTLTGPGVSGPLLTQLRIMVPTEPAAPQYQQYGNWYIRFNSPGCYGLQIDWSQGAEWIILRAEAG